MDQGPELCPAPSQSSHILPRPYLIGGALLGIAHVGYIYALEHAGIRFRWKGTRLWSISSMQHSVRFFNPKK